MVFVTVLVPEAKQQAATLGVIELSKDLAGFPNTPFQPQPLTLKCGPINSFQLDVVNGFVKTRSSTRVFSSRRMARSIRLR